MITGKIDVTKIDKSLLFESQKTGAKYLDIVLIETPNSQYGDTHMILQSLPKKRRDAGERGAILGNAKEFSGGGGGGNAEHAVANDPGEDLPF